MTRNEGRIVGRGLLSTEPRRLPGAARNEARRFRLSSSSMRPATLHSIDDARCSSGASFCVLPTKCIEGGHCTLLPWELSSVISYDVPLGASAVTVPVPG